jgi:hypothetical protein
LGLNRREIPRFARNDKISYFLRSLFSLWRFVIARTKPRRLKPALPKAIRPRFFLIPIDSEEDVQILRGEKSGLEPPAAIGDPPAQPAERDGRSQGPPKRQSQIGHHAR